MISALLFFIVSLRVYKKTTPNGKITVYLGKRNFIDHCDGNVDPVEGVVNVETDYLKGRKIFGQFITTYRYGREEDEVMGVKFSKTIPLAMVQVVPPEQDGIQTTKLQQRLVNKLGENAYPFYFTFPSTAPSSVVLLSGDPNDKSKPLGVEYRIRTFVGESTGDLPHKRSTVIFTVKKLQYAPIEHLDRLPCAIASKSFTFSHGKVAMEITLSKEVYYHGESIRATMIVTNNSRKKVKNLKFYVMQHVELTMVKMKLVNYVASLETREGCPIMPGHSFSKEFLLTPLAANNADKRGVALDGYLKDDDVNLASSTISTSGQLTNDSLGVVVTYTVRGKLGLGTLGGELLAEVPLKLVHVDSTTGIKPQTEKNPAKDGLTRWKSVDRAHYENKPHTPDDEDNIVFEDFARTRLSEAED